MPIYLLQLVGVLLTAMGMLALMASTFLYGTPLTQSEKRRSGHSDRHGKVYHLPFNVETVASGLFLLAGIGILSWTKFNLCAFLAHWLPDLPAALRIFLSCG